MASLASAALMATQLFLRNDGTWTHRGDNSAKLDGSNTGWQPQNVGLGTRGNGLVTGTGGTVTGPTNGVEISNVEWITPPIDQDVTISGAITGNIWASESNMSANVAINFIVFKLAANTWNLTEIVRSARTTEVAVTTRAVNNFTATPGTGVTLNKGDRLLLRIFGDDAGTMASGFTFNIGYNGTTASADGDTYLTFTETFGFQETNPTGTKLYLRSTASDVGTASTVDKEMWTTAGATASVYSVTNTQNGWVTPFILTDSAGGTAIEWFSKPLQAFTLSGLARMQVRNVESNSGANTGIRAEIERVDQDGTNPTLWGIGYLQTGFIGECLTTEGNQNLYIAGDDLTFTDGQRIRLRLYLDDTSTTQMATGWTVSLRYDDADATTSWLQVEQTLAEFVAGPAASLAVPRKDRSLPLRDFDPWGTGWL